ncbi:MAG: hypothetical protein H7331_02895 [Bacteroidia bacterium]|nr:hypothetical protein [Bacteroidia bacterium]
MKKTLLLLSFIALLFTLYAKYLYMRPAHNFTSGIKETFNAKTMAINTIEKLEDTLAARVQNNYADTGLLVNSIDDLLRIRFFHSYSIYTYKENWIATLLGNYVWQDFKYVVIPQHIIKYPMAACSQQGILFQYLLKKHNVKFATIQFQNNDGESGHYAVNAYYQGSWHYFDSNMEPKKLKGNPSMQSLLHDSLLTKVYPVENKKWLESKIKGGLIHRINENREGASTMIPFHYFTAFMSNWLWLFLALLYIILNSKVYINGKAILLNKLTN